MITQVKILDPQLIQRIGKSIISFEAGVNLLVGENGCGKSSLIEAIREEILNPSGTQVRIIRDEHVPVEFYSSEESTRDSNVVNKARISDTAISHGQRLNRYIDTIMRTEGEHVLIADEIEAALDFDTVYGIGATLSKVSAIQWIISTHHPILFTLKNANIVNLSRTDSNYIQSCLKKLGKRIK